MYHHSQQPMPWRHWLKWLVVVDLQPQLVLAQKAHAGPTNDGANLRPLVDTAHSVSSIGLVLADAEFDSERTLPTSASNECRRMSTKPAGFINRFWLKSGTYVLPNIWHSCRHAGRIPARVQVFSEYVDLGISGSKESRPELNRLMANAHRRNFDVELCWKVDCFGRSLERLVNALANLDSYGVAFVSLSVKIWTCPRLRVD
jgi:hypothetical protein